MNYEQTMRFISSYKIAEIIPLDWVLHFFVGAIFTIVLLKLKFRLRNVVIILGVLELIKEIFDFQSMTATYTEAILDYIITMAFPLFLYITRLLKEKIQDMD